MREQGQKEQPVARHCYPFLFLGASGTQFSIALFGLIASCLIFRSHPNTGYDVAGTSSLVPISILVVGMLASGIARGWETLKILKSGEIVPVRLLKVQEDTSHEDMEYRLSFENDYASGPVKKYETVRTVNDLAVGATFPLLISDTLRVAILEPNLPGGITFANIYDGKSIPRKVWLRILFIPFLTILPLLGLVEPISYLLQQATVIIGFPILYWLTIALQLIWYHSNRRYFSPGERMELGG